MPTDVFYFTMVDPPPPSCLHEHVSLYTLPLTSDWENCSISKSMRTATPDRPTPALQWTTVVESDGADD